MKTKLIKAGIAVMLFLLYWGMPGAQASEAGTQCNDLNLTAEETAWIRQHPSVRAAGPLAFPPFHYYDEKGRLKGMSADYLFCIMDGLGVRVEVQPPQPWARVLEKARAGQVDLIACIAKSHDREAYLEFSYPYLSFPLVILSRKDAPFIGGIQDLYGKRLAVIPNNVTLSWLKEDGISFDPVFVASPLKRLEAISLGRVDAGIENLAAASYLIQKNGLTNIKVAAPTPYETYDLHMAVRKGLTPLLSILNKALIRMPPEKHMEMRSRWLSVRYEHGIRKSDILRWVLMVAGVAAVIVSVIMVWNRKLQKEVAARIQVIGELEAAMAEIKTLKGIVPICAKCKKIRDDKGYWKRLEAFIEEHSQASFSHGICPDCLDQLYGGEKWYARQKADSTAKTDEESQG